MTKIEVKLNPDVTPAGSDLSIVNAARRSFNQRSEWEIVGHSSMTHRLEKVNLLDYTWVHSGSGGYYQKLKDKDKRLLHFLARGMTADDFEAFIQEAFNESVSVCYDEVDFYKEELKKKLWEWRNTPTHDTPFNHTFISFEVKMPVIAARQLVKTEYTILSEISRRYITSEIEFYEHNYRNQSKNKKQGSYGEHPHNEMWQVSSRENAVRSVELYNKMVDDGVAIEQARGELPLNLMIEATWSGTLGAFAKMCRERLHPEAQYESRLVAKQVYKYLQEYYPVASRALVEGPDV